MMDNIIQETIQYTRQRKIFKQPVLYHQSVRFRLAELQTEVELLRSLVHRATGRDRRQTPVGTTFPWQQQSHDPLAHVQICSL